MGFVDDGFVQGFLEEIQVLGGCTGLPKDILDVEEGVEAFVAHDAVIHLHVPPGEVQDSGTVAFEERAAGRRQRIQPGAVQHRDGRHLGKSSGSGTGGYGYKGIISS